MTTTDSVFQRAMSNMLTEIFDGPPGQEAYLLNPGDPGLLRQLDSIEADLYHIYYFGPLGRGAWVFASAEVHDSSSVDNAR